MKMNKLNILILILSLVVGVQFASAQNENPDTLLNVEGPSKIVITENQKGAKFEVTGDSTVDTIVTLFPEESTVVSKQSSKSESFLKNGFIINGTLIEWPYHWDVIVDGLCLGLTNATDMAGEGGLQWSKSLEIGWISCIGVVYKYKASGISLGMGFDWRNYKITTSEKRLVANKEKGIEWEKYPEGAKGRNSRLKIFSLQFPLLYRLAIPKTSINLKVGPMMNFNTYASLKSSYEDGAGNKCREFTKDIQPRRFTVDFFGSISLLSNAVGVYVRYSPMKVMDAPGLNFRPLTVGLLIGL